MPGRAWAIALLAAVALSGALLGALPAVAQTVVLDQGHVDVGLDFESGAAALKLHDQTVIPEVQRDPADVTLRALPDAETTVPSDPAFSFLGNPGDPVWILPQTQDPDLLWLGWNTEDISTGTFVGNSVTWRLKGVSGPGDFSLFTTGQFGVPTVRFNSGDGITGADAMNVSIQSHAHGNWAFTAPGTYQVDFELLGTLVSGNQPVTTGDVTYTFDVQAPSVGGLAELPAVTALPLNSNGGWQPWIPAGGVIAIVIVAAGVLRRFLGSSRRTG
jgi:surface-anchored protein